MGRPEAPGQARGGYSCQIRLTQARAKGTRVLIGDPGRTYFPRSGLTFLAEYRVPTTRELEDQEIKRSSVWAMP